MILLPKLFGAGSSPLHRKSLCASSNATCSTSPLLHRIFPAQSPRLLPVLIFHSSPWLLTCGIASYIFLISSVNILFLLIYQDKLHFAGIINNGWNLISWPKVWLSSTPGLFVLHVVTQGSSCFHPAVLLAQHVFSLPRQGRRAALDVPEGLGLMVALHNLLTFIWPNSNHLA